MKYRYRVVLLDGDGNEVQAPDEQHEFDSPELFLGKRKEQLVADYAYEAAQMGLTARVDFIEAIGDDDDDEAPPVAEAV